MSEKQDIEEIEIYSMCKDCEHVNWIDPNTGKCVSNCKDCKLCGD